MIYTTNNALDALVTTMTRLADDMEKHATDEWDEHENVSAAIATITALRAAYDAERKAVVENVALKAEVARLTAELQAEDAFAEDMGEQMENDSSRSY